MRTEKVEIILKGLKARKADIGTITCSTEKDSLKTADIVFDSSNAEGTFDDFMEMTKECKKKALIVLDSRFKNMETIASTAARPENVIGTRTYHHRHCVCMFVCVCVRTCVAQTSYKLSFTSPFYVSICVLPKSHHSPLPLPMQRIYTIIRCLSNPLPYHSLCRTLCTEHGIPYTVYRTLCIEHGIPYTVYRTLYTVHCIPYTLYRTMYTVHCRFLFKHRWKENSRGHTELCNFS